jgi:hypothetical protein
VKHRDSSGAGPVPIGDEDETALVYASDVRIVAEPGGLQLLFTRPRAKTEHLGQRSRDYAAATEIIARVVLPPSVAQRLLRLLPTRLDQQQALAEEYARETDEKLERDPFLAALADAEYDDEPFTDEQREAARIGWEEYQRGETAPWEEFRRELLAEDETPSVPTL